MATAYLKEGNITLSSTLWKDAGRIVGTLDNDGSVLTLVATAIVSMKTKVSEDVKKIQDLITTHIIKVSKVRCWQKEQSVRLLVAKNTLEASI